MPNFQKERILMLIILGLAGAMNTSPAQSFDTFQEGLIQNEAINQIAPQDPDQETVWGSSLALLGDTLFVGVPGIGNNDVEGSVWRLVFNGSSWDFDHQLTSPGGAGDGFGHAVAAADSILAIGAPYAENSEGEATGKVYLYIREGDDWSLRHTLAPEFLYDESLFGFSVAADSGRVIVGAPGRHFIDEVMEDTIRHVGSAYGFDLTWNYDGEELNHSNMNISMPRRDEQFGYDVAVKGRWAVVGTNPAGLSAISAPFRAALFEQPRIANPGWQSREILTRDDRPGDHGESVAASRQTAFVGAPSKVVDYPDSDESSSMGSVFAYHFDSGDGEIQGEQELTPSHPRSFLSYGRGMMADDETLAVSGLDMVDLYGRKSGMWERSHILVADTAGEMRFGSSVDFNDRFIVVSGTLGSGEDLQSRIFWVDQHAVTASDRQADPPEIAENVTLHAAYPNPFNPSTVIGYDLPDQSEVRLEIYRITGERVAVLAEGTMPAGQHSQVWDATGFASGIYLVRLQVDDVAKVRRVTLVK